jgi:hypothetical protein
MGKGIEIKDISIRYANKKLKKLIKKGGIYVYSDMEFFVYTMCS